MSDWTLEDIKKAYSYNNRGEHSYPFWLIKRLDESIAREEKLLKEINRYEGALESIASYGPTEEGSTHLQKIAINTLNVTNTLNAIDKIKENK